MRYATARWSREQKEVAYRAYVTDSIKIACENTAKFAGGSYMNRRYIDIVNPPPEETRTAAEIIAQIKGKLREISDA